MHPLKIRGREYHLTFLTGKIIGNPHMSQVTHVISVPSPDGSATIRTENINLNNFVIEDEQNIHHAVHLKGFNLICLPGHELKIISSSLYGLTPVAIAVCNRSTRMAYFNHGELIDMHRANKFLFIWLPSLILFLLGWIYNAVSEMSGLHFLRQFEIIGYWETSFFTALELSPLTFFIPLWILFGLWKKSGNMGLKKFKETFNLDNYSF